MRGEGVRLRAEGGGWYGEKNVTGVVQEKMCALYVVSEVVLGIIGGISKGL